MSEKLALEAAKKAVVRKAREKVYIAQLMTRARRFGLGFEVPKSRTHKLSLWKLADQEHGPEFLEETSTSVEGTPTGMERDMKLLHGLVQN